MRTRKGLGPARCPQTDNSRPSSPAVPPEPRRLTPRLPRSKGTAAAGPHAAMPGDSARGHGAAGRTQALCPDSPPWTSPPPAARRPRPLHGRHPELAAPASTGALRPAMASFHFRVHYSPPGHTPRQPEPWGAQNRPPSSRHPSQCSWKLASFLRKFL